MEIHNKLKKFKLVKFIIIGIFLVELVVPLIYLYIKQIEKCFNTNYLINITNLLNSPKILANNPIIFVILIGILVIFFMTYYNLKISLKNANIETEGIKFRKKDGTHGTAGFANINDLKHILQVGNEKNTNGIILGKTIDTDEIIILPDSYKKLNRNIMVFGASGSGKSRKFIVPNILKIAEQDERARNLENAIQQGKNMIVTDPKGELYCKTCRLLEKEGYNVKLFNLVDPEYSDGIDLIRFIDKDVDAQTFAQVVMTTTLDIGTKRGDEFWQNTQENLLKALLLHTVLEVEDKDKRNMGYIYSILASGDIKKIDRVFQNSKEITKMAYNIYAQASDNIKQSVITGLATKLQIFQLKEIDAITKKNDIDFLKLNDEKLAIFCVISDMDSTMSFLSSLFFSFLFIKVIRMADDSPTKMLKRELCIILDEFPNIGQIPDFQKKLATIRSRGVSCIVVCQGVSNLEALYPNNLWQGIVANTDIKIITGCNDIQTADYISKMLRCIDRSKSIY